MKTIIEWRSKWKARNVIRQRIKNVIVAVRGPLKLTTEESCAIYWVNGADQLLHHRRADNFLCHQFPVFRTAIRAICTTWTLSQWSWTRTGVATTHSVDRRPEVMPSHTHQFITNLGINTAMKKSRGWTVSGRLCPTQHADRKVVLLI